VNREQEFLARWHVERDAYLAWAEHVSTRIAKALEPLIEPVTTSYFLRSAVRPRLKDDLKLVEKAFYRGKRYDDPYTRITDKVGTRFVVLLGRDIRTVVEAIESISGWTRSKDRDYEEEQKENPVAFDYAAVHFVVRPDEDTVDGGVRILAGTPCEVQIKTLLQHAYSELTHDTLYKPQIEATTAMRRNAAKSMALLEATNDYFEKVQDEVDHALAAVREMTASLSSIYRGAVGFDPKPSALEGLLLAAYEADAGDFAADIGRLLKEKPYIADAIRRRVAESNPIFAQPSVLLAYLEIYRSPRTAKQRWPLTPWEHQPLLTDLGEGED
jgi:putative GTP pyrophosphokinase